MQKAESRTRSAMEQEFGVLPRRRPQPRPPTPPRRDTGARRPAGQHKRDRNLGPLHRAAATGDVRRLRQLLVGAEHSLDQRDTWDRTPLHLACAYGYPDVVSLLVERKCQLNLGDFENQTPLIKAVQGQQEECTSILLKHGADPHLADAFNNTALHYAASGQNTAIVTELLQHKSDIEAKNRDGHTPLLLAIAEQNKGMVEFFLKKGANVNAMDRNQRTALMIALKGNLAGMLSVLLKYDVTLSCQDKHGCRAEKYASASSIMAYHDLAELCVQQERRMQSNRTLDSTLGGPDVNKGVMDEIFLENSIISLFDSGPDDHSSPTDEELKFDTKEETFKENKEKALINNGPREVSAHDATPNISTGSHSHHSVEHDATGQAFVLEEVEDYQSNQDSKDKSFKKIKRNALINNGPREVTPNGATPSISTRPHSHHPFEPGATVQAFGLDEGEDYHSNREAMDKSLKKMIGNTLSNNGPREATPGDTTPSISTDPHSHHSFEVGATGKEGEDHQSTCDAMEKSFKKKKRNPLINNGPREATTSDAIPSISTGPHSHNSFELGATGQAFGLEEEDYKSHWAAMKKAFKKIIENALTNKASREVKPSDASPSSSTGHHSHHSSDLASTGLAFGLEEGDDYQSLCDSMEKAFKTLKGNAFITKGPGEVTPSDASSFELGATGQAFGLEEGEDYKSHWAAMKKAFKIILENALTNKGSREVKPSGAPPSISTGHHSHHSPDLASTGLEGEDYKSHWSAMKKAFKIILENALTNKGSREVKPSGAPPSISTGHHSHHSPDLASTGLAFGLEEGEGYKSHWAAMKKSLQKKKKIVSINNGPREFKSSDAPPSISTGHHSHHSFQHGATGQHLIHELEFKGPSEERHESLDKNDQEQGKVQKDADEINDLTASPDRSKEDYNSTPSLSNLIMLLIEKLCVNCKDSIKLLQIKDIILKYERSVKLKNVHCILLTEKVKSLENTVIRLQEKLSETKAMKSQLFQLENQKHERDRELCSIRFALKQEEEKRLNAEILFKNLKKQSGRKKTPYNKEMELRQQLESSPSSLDMELTPIKSYLKQVEMERNDALRQLAQEKRARTLQERILNDLSKKREKEAVASKRILSLKVADSHEREKHLEHKIHGLKKKVAALELAQGGKIKDNEKIIHQFLKANKILEEKNELSKELKDNKEALTQTICHLSEQINILRSENAMLKSKFKNEKQNRVRSEAKIETCHSHLTFAGHDHEQSQTLKVDLPHNFQQDWLHSEDTLSCELSSLTDNTSVLSQELSYAESTVNGSKNELSLLYTSLGAKTLTLESTQNELNQPQHKLLQGRLQMVKEKLKQYAVEQESFQESIRHIQKVNALLQEQLEDVQKHGIFKKKFALVQLKDFLQKFEDKNVLAKIEVEDLHSEIEVSKCPQVVSKRKNPQEDLSFFEKLEKKNNKMEKNIREWEEGVKRHRHQLEMAKMEYSQIEQYKYDLEEEARQQILERQKEASRFMQS
ncbi:uncharacterized protein LOC141504033 isoform X3 [Macrotis lagotis]|uniref:uncharacterized protein LOC141504033 isoform X3 n=1 Tax=Macrotis lagotis TaxID=92651 RepID=UPI003D69D16B